MNTSLLAGLGFLALSCSAGAIAQDSPAIGSTAAKSEATKPDAVKPELKSAQKEDLENRIRIEFDLEHRLVSAFYSNDSQARLKIYVVNRFDSEIARPREYFIAELFGAAIIEPLKLDVDDAESTKAIIGILERFKSESEKSGKLKGDMNKRKVALEADLSREETKLVELLASSNPISNEVELSRVRISKIKEALALATEIGSMSKISGVMGRAKINLDRPAYEFVANFEPNKELYTLNAGYSFQVSSKHVKFYLDLLNRAEEFKKQLLEAESNAKRLREEVDSLFNEGKSKP